MDVYNAEIVPVAKNVNSNGQTDASVVSQVAKENLPEELATEDQQEVEHKVAMMPERCDSVDVAATQGKQDSVDVITSSQLRKQNPTSGLYATGSHGASKKVDCRELKKVDAKTKLICNNETLAENSNMRPKTPSMPGSHEYRATDDTASSPSMSFSLPTTDAPTEDFVEVLSSHLLHTMAKKHRHSQTCCGYEGSGVETDTGHQVKFSEKSTTTGMTAGATAVQPELVNIACCATDAQGSLQDCNELASGAAYRTGRILGVEGYLRRSEAAADCRKWSRPPDCAEFIPVKQNLAEPRTTAATGHEVMMYNYLLHS